MSRRVVITGIGAITPIGTGAEALWEGVLANRSAVRLIDRFDPSPFASRVAAQVEDFDPAAHLDARRGRERADTHDRQIGMDATVEEIEDEAHP